MTMLTVQDRAVLAGVLVGVAISFLVASVTMMVFCACTRKGQQDTSGRRTAPPPRSNGGDDGRTPPPTPVEQAAAVDVELAGPLLCTYMRADGWQHQHQHDAMCGVCLAELADGDALMVLPPCMHYFHAACVGDWIYLHASCPFCRAPVAAARPDTAY